MKARTPFASIFKSFSSGTVYELATKVYFLYMGVGRIFSRGVTRVFFLIFSRGGQKWWNLFFPTRNYKNNLFFLKFSKFKGALAPLPPPSDARVSVIRYTLCWIGAYSHNWVWDGPEPTISTFAVLSLVCVFWTQLTMKPFVQTVFYTSPIRNAFSFHKLSNIHFWDHFLQIRHDLRTINNNQMNISGEKSWKLDTLAKLFQTMRNGYVAWHNCRTIYWN